MARAKRHYLPGHLWHITHRCHKREWLLKFKRDRHRWLQWLFIAKKRCGLVILNYSVTSNHIHLLVVDDGDRAVIPQSMQLMAGRTGQEYNLRKNRTGAFWEDRYHATAIECGEYLLRCMVYIDLNMVRAGVVNHPSEWIYSGYNEIHKSRYKCSLIAHESVRTLTGFDSINRFRIAYADWISDALRDGTHEREPLWTESIAAGSEQFVQSVDEALGEKARGRKLVNKDNLFYLREDPIPYATNFGPKNVIIGGENSLFLKDSLCFSNG
jgi:putative transposase